MNADQQRNRNENRNEITPQHRRYEILEIVFSTEEKVRTGDLAKRFAIGLNLLAYDLKILEEMGLIERGHGWCRRRATAIDDLFSKTEYAARRARHTEAKQAIARYIVDQLIEDGTHLLIDAGSTAFEVGKQLVEQGKNVMVTTNNLPLSLTLARNSMIPCYMAGGEYRRSHAAIAGPGAAEAIAGRKADVGILTPRSISFWDHWSAQGNEPCGPAVRRALGQLAQSLGRDPDPHSERDLEDVASQNFYLGIHCEDAAQHPYKETLIKNSNRLIIAVDHSKFAISGEAFFALILSPLLQETSLAMSAPILPIRTRGPVRTRGAVAQIAPARAALDIDVRDPVDLREPASVTIVTNAEAGGRPPRALMQMLDALREEPYFKGVSNLAREVIKLVDAEGRPIERW